MEAWKKDRIGSCVSGENPTVIVKMRSGFAVMADNQFLPGYCILLRYPRAGSLAELSLQERSEFLLDTTLIGDAIEEVCKPRRVNYSTLMNTDPFVHTHIEARYDWESEEYKYRPSWTYPEAERYQKQYEFSEETHGALRKQLAKVLKRRMAEAYGEAESPDKGG